MRDGRPEAGHGCRVPFISLGVNVSPFNVFRGRGGLYALNVTEFLFKLSKPKKDTGEPQASSYDV